MNDIKQMKKNKTKDPYPITDIYFVDMNAVDAATVTVGDLCERLSNDLNLGGGISDILSQLKKVKSKKYNSISFENGADGGYSVWVGVDHNNKVRKIFAEANIADYMRQPEDAKNYMAYSGDKVDMNDQFFSKPSNWLRKEHKNVKRIKLFNLTTSSGLICVHDHGGPLRFEHPEAIKEVLDEKYFKKNGIFQKNYPIGLFEFFYGVETEPYESTYKKSVIHDPEKGIDKRTANYTYTEFLSNLLDKNCYPTKYIFEDYLEEFAGYREKTEIRIKEGVKISGEYLYKRIPKALEILNKQTKILFKENFKEVFEIRKSQFENFIHGIIKDVEPQELELPTFGKKTSKNKLSKIFLKINKIGLHDPQDALYDGYKLKEDTMFGVSALIFRVKKGTYPLYLHCYSIPDDDPSLHGDLHNYEYVKIVVEGLEDCYLNKNNKGKLVLNKKFKESSFVRNAIYNKLKSISIDKVDLRKSDSLKELKKLNFVEDLTLYGLDTITNWDPLSKLRNLRKLKFISCDVKREVSNNFFKNLYSLKKLEEFEIDDSSSIQLPKKETFPKHLFLPKLKTFKIDFRKEWKDKSKAKGYENYQGYGSLDTYFLHIHLPAINKFPNFEKFKSLEKINLYNLFSEEAVDGELFNAAPTDYLKKFEDMGKIIRNFKKLKHIWIHGFDLKGDISFQTEVVQECLEALTKRKKVLINGKNIKTSATSSNFKGIKRLELVSKIEQYWEPKLISQDKDKITLNYFANIKDKKCSDLLKNCFNQKLEEIIISPAYQFFRSENMYDNTFKLIEDHIKKNKKLKNIIFEFDENSVSEDYGDMAGSWYDWDSEALSRFVFDLLSQNAHLRIIINHPEFKKQIGKNIKFDKYFRLFNLYQVIADDRKTRNRFEILGFNSKEIDLHLNKFLLERINMLVVIEDNRGWNDSKNIRNVEFLSKADIKDGSQTFAFSEFTKKITPSYEGTKPYVAESKLLCNIFETGFYQYSDSKYWHFANSRIDDTYEGPIVLVKQSFLDKAKKTIFKNIKHYFYFAEVDYTYDDLRDTLNYKRFWKKNEYFKLPKSVKFNKLETLNIFNGRNVKLDSLPKQADCSNLKQLILYGCTGKDKALPKLPNLEILAIRDKYNEKAKPFSKLSNLPKLKHLEFSGLFSYNDDNTRWNASEFDFTDIHKLSSLSYLKMQGVNPEYLPPLKILKNLEELELTFQLITADMNSDEGTIDRNLIDKDFEFLNDLKKLKKLNLDIPYDVSNVKGPLLLSYVNPGIEELVLDLHYEDQKINHGYETINYITKHFKKLRKLKLIMGRNEKFETSSKKKLIYFRKTGESWKEGKEGPRPFVLDLGKFVVLKKLEQINFSQSYRDDMGFKVINPVQITKLKKIKKINIQDDKFSSEDLVKIRNITEGPRDKFLEACKKKDKSIKSEYDLPEKDRKKHDLLDEREIRFDSTYDSKWSGERIEDILKKRKKKKK